MSREDLSKRLREEFDNLRATYEINQNGQIEIQREGLLKLTSGGEELYFEMCTLPAGVPKRADDHISAVLQELGVKPGGMVRYRVIVEIDKYIPANSLANYSEDKEMKRPRAADVVAEVRRQVESELVALAFSPPASRVHKRPRAADVVAEVRREVERELGLILPREDK